MQKLTYLTLLCTVVIVGLLIPPVLAVEIAPGGAREFVSLDGDEHPDIDGNMIVWERSLLKGPKDIYCMATSGNDIRRLTDDDASQERPSISGDHVAWQDNRNGNWDIYLYSFSENRTRQLTSDSADQWLPVVHGNYVVWYDNTGGQTDIVLYDIVAGKEKTTIVCNPVLGGDVTKFKPALSDEYVAWEEAGSGLMLYEIATGARRAVSPSTMPQSWPSISGDLIAWEDYRWGEAWQSAIYLRNIETGRERQLTTLSNEQVSPALSESIIAWEDKRDERWSIYMYDLSDGVEEMSVPTTGGEQLYPAVSGNTIVWQKGRGEFANICVYTYVPGEPVRTVTRIEVEPSGATMDIGEEVKFNATCYDEDGVVIPGLKVAWSCSSDTLGFLDPGGYFLAYEAGTATITAATAGVTGTATVTVNAGKPVIDQITVAPATVTLEIDGAQQFSATAFDESGNKMNGVDFAWSCSNETVGEIDADGLFTALAAGTTTVTATAGDITGTATVTVSTEAPVATTIVIEPPTTTLEVDGTRQFTATVLDQFGGEMADDTVEWTCSNETVGTIGSSSGLFTALAAGTATVTATADGITETATVTVTAEAPVEPELKDITVTPTTAALEIGGTERFAATALDQNGLEITGVEFAWSCSDETVGEIDADGLFTARAAGTATVTAKAVTAKAGDLSGTATVTVNAEEPPVGPEEPVLTSITVTPPRATLDVDDIQKFIVTAYDQNGNAMSAGEVAWSCSDEGVGTVDGGGVFTAKAAGTATVTITAGNCSAEAPVTVNAEEPALAKIAVVPSAATLEVGDELAFDAVAFDRLGNIVPDAEITWECSDECVGMIDECGVFTALAAGTATVTACGDGAEGTATVTVNCDDPTVTRIVVTPPAITLAEGDTAAFTATALDQDGCEMPDVKIEWECSDETVGEVDSTGFFTALAAGTATVTASAGGVAGTADVEVTDESTGVVVSPSAIILDAGETWEFTVYDLQDNAGSSVAWSCADPGVGEIDESSGLFTALAAGTATVTATVAGENETATGTATVTVRSTTPELARIEVGPSDFCIPAGNTLALTARGFDQYGFPMDVDVTWESSDPCVGTIGECNGVFTAICDGEVRLIASADGVSGSACVTVLPSLPVPACIEVEPAEAALAPGEARAFTATVFDQCGNVMDWVRVAWSCSNPGVGTIDRAGLFAAFAEGTADVTACAGGVEGTAPVTVTAAPTTEPTPDPTTEPANPGSGGGSTNRGWSDGGGDSGPTFFAGICENLRGGEMHTFSGITISSVDSIGITASDNIPKLMVTVKKTGCPNLAEPPGDTYEYIEIAVSWVNQRDISGATVTFTIPAKWLDEHGILPEDVRLMRYVDGGWQILETEVVGEESGLYRFRATTPGFSTFAIAAMPENVTVTAAANATAEETNVTATMTEEATTEPTTAVPTTTPTAPLVYAPFLAPLGFLLWRRRKN